MIVLYIFLGLFIYELIGALVWKLCNWVSIKAKLSRADGIFEDVFLPFIIFWPVVILICLIFIVFVLPVRYLRKRFIKNDGA